MPSSRANGGCKNWFFASLAFSVAVFPGVASATLGEPEDSVQTDGAKFNGSIKVTEQPNYRLHEIKLPSGSSLREFVGADGKVFAVAWSGPTVPNLRQVFGQYFDEYASAAQSAAQTTRSDHTHSQVHTSDLVVQSSGHMRALSGRAYLFQAIPSGVSLGDIR
jgi:hypothetical protein